MPIHSCNRGARTNPQLGSWIIMSQSRPQAIHADRLVIIAGPSSVGKSVLIDKLQQDKLPWLSDQLGLGDLSKWRVMDGVELARWPESDTIIDRLLLHLAFPVLSETQQLRRVPSRREDSEATTLVYKSVVSIVTREVAIVTLVASASTLVRRARRRQLRSVAVVLRRHTISSLKGLGRLRRKKRIYSDAAQLSSRYSQWLDACSQFGATVEVLVDVEGQPRIVPTDALPGILGA